MFPSLRPGRRFDAASVLGIGTPPGEALPSAAPGEVALRIPDGLSLQSLRDSPVGKRLMQQQRWYDACPWSREALPAGAYVLRLPVPDSDRKSAHEQEAVLPPGEAWAPAALVAASLLCLRAQDGCDPLDGRWVRCRELPDDGFRVALVWNADRLLVSDYGDGRRYSYLWAASARALP